MNLAMNAAYAALVDVATLSHEKNRNPEEVTTSDIRRARLYCYAFRLHVIGAFHATRLALQEIKPASQVADAYRLRASESLEDLTHLSMEPIPDDFRAVIVTFYRYHRGVTRVLDSFEREGRASQCSRLQKVARHFHTAMEAISTSSGIFCTQDLEAPEQASFVVPNLGIVIVPVVYGDHHSWNLAYLVGEERNVPTHRHYHGVEIHLGYNPTHGVTVLGSHRAEVDEGYAMPIPPETDHGWVNTSDGIHNVPFVFGSRLHGGWGVFLDVEAQSGAVEDLTLVDRDHPSFGQMVYLEREIASASQMASTWRRVLIPHTVTNRHGSGGLELAITRINKTGFTFSTDSFRIVCVVRGQGVVQMDDIEQKVGQHDHFGVPAGMSMRLIQTGDEPLVTLDTLLRGMTG